ncbi:MAG: rhodanese-like domain-containing protein, partial [bacterium]
GAGSACGKALGAVPSTTLGYEKIANWALVQENEAEFVRDVLAGQPEPPKYFADMKRINRDGPTMLNGFSRPPRIESGTLAEMLADDALVVDTRTADAYAEHFVRGTINIPLTRSFTNWAGSLIPFDHDFYLIVDDTDGRAVDEAVRDLAMIGLDRIAGYFGVDAVDSQNGSDVNRGTIRQMTVHELSALDRANDVQVVDVRGAAEWSEGHLPGVQNIPLGQLAEHLSELSKDRPVVLQCQGGGRSAIAASILEKNGFTDVANLVGGYREWAASGLPIEKTPDST